MTFLQGILDWFKSGEVVGVLSTLLIALAPYAGIINSTVSKCVGKFNASLPKVNERLDEAQILIKELQASDIYTANYQEASVLFSLGYRKESDTAKDFAKTIKSVIWEEFENETIRIKDLHGVIDDILRSKYGVEVEE